MHIDTLKAFDRRRKETEAEYRGRIDKVYDQKRDAAKSVNPGPELVALDAKYGNIAEQYERDRMNIIRKADEERAEIYKPFDVRIAALEMEKLEAIKKVLEELL